MHRRMRDLMDKLNMKGFIVISNSNSNPTVDSRWYGLHQYLFICNGCILNEYVQLIEIE